MKEKLLILFGIVLLLLVILVLRITYINATSGSKYKKQVLSQAQQKYESQVLPAKRGDIYDKNGNILATSNKVYNVILDCKTVNSDEDYVEPTIRALNEVLGIDEETVRSLLADSRTSQSQYQVLTKQLSMDKKKEFEKIKETYQNIGYTVIETIAKELENAEDISSKNITSSTGIQELEKNLKGNINAFSGNSGVGKSTLINAIFNDTITQEGEISQRNKKGKNTTTSTKLYEIDENTYIADTPGFSTFDISEIEYRKLDQYFKEFKPLLENCEFVGCTHIKEQNCGIKKALEKGKIDSGRYERFCKIYEELKEKERYKW